MPGWITEITYTRVDGSIKALYHIDLSDINRAKVIHQPYQDGVGDDLEVMTLVDAKAEIIANGQVAVKCRLNTNEPENVVIPGASWCPGEIPEWILPPPPVPTVDPDYATLLKTTGAPFLAATRDSKWSDFAAWYRSRTPEQIDSNVALSAIQELAHRMARLIEFE